MSYESSIKHSSIIEVVITVQLDAAERDRHHPVAPCELPDGIQFVYVDDSARRRVIALDEAGAIDFGRTRLFREPPAYRRQRNFPGWWWSVTTRSHVVYESWLERHHIIEADRDARVTGIAGQPFALTWPSGKQQVHHVPDLFCRVFNGSGVVTDCRLVTKANANSGTSARSPQLPARWSDGSSAWLVSQTQSGLPTCGGSPDTAIRGSPTPGLRRCSSALSLSRDRWPKRQAR